MRRLHLTTVALLAVVALVLPAQSGAHWRPAPPDTYVAAWDDVGSRAFTAAALSPAEGYLILGYQSIAVYDAVMAIDGGYQPFAVATHAPRRASAQAAVAAAARGILLHHLPAQGPTVVEPAYVASLATIADGPAKTAGVAVGARVAAALIAQRADDGFRTPVGYTPPDPPIPGAWLPTAPSPPLGTYLGHMRPLSLASADELRPGPPPALSSKRWARDYNEVKEIGSSTSATRTPEQTLAARFWAEPPVQQDHAAYRRFVADHALDVVQAARFMAMASVTNADSLIACFDAKYHYAFWRPITAIRAGDTDGNPATVADPAWSPILAGTPNHPEYPSAHSCVTAGAARVFARFLGTGRIDVTVPSITGLGDRSFATGRDLREEVGNARIWGGIHFRTAVEEGLTIGARTARQVLSRHFQQR